MDYNYQHLATASTPPNPKRPGEQSVMLLEGTTDVLRQRLSALIERLGPLLAQVPPNVKETQAYPAQPGSSLVVEKIHSITLRLEMMAEEINIILSRLEV